MLMLLLLIVIDLFLDCGTGDCSDADIADPFNYISVFMVNKTQADHACPGLGSSVCGRCEDGPEETKA